MATAQDLQLARDGLASAAERIVDFKEEELLREKLGEALNFVNQAEHLISIKKLYEQVKRSDLSRVPYQPLVDTRNAAEQTLRVFESLKSFDPARVANAAFDTRRSLENELENAWTTSFQTVAPILAAAQVDRTQAEIDFYRTRNADLTTTLQAKVEEAESILNAMRSASSQVGIGTHSQHFQKEAIYHRDQARLWAAASAGFAVAVIAYAHMSTITIGIPLAATVLNLSHVVVTVLLTFGVVWCARMFSASRHNFVVNRHRMNALSSFETFVKSASDEQTKNAVLVQATTSIFAPQESGFIKGEQTPYPGSQVIEILKSTAGKDH
jgi:hypothetical protein